MLPKAVLEKHIPHAAKIPDQPDRDAWENLGWGGVPQLKSGFFSHSIIEWTRIFGRSGLSAFSNSTID